MVRRFAGSHRAFARGLDRSAMPMSSLPHERSIVSLAVARGPPPKRPSELTTFVWSPAALYTRIRVGLPRLAPAASEIFPTADRPQDGAPSGAATAPLPGAQLGGRIILERLLGSMKDERGVHVESLATALGALAGRACQLAALQGLSSGAPEYQGLSLMTVGGANGDEYFVGDAINRPLAEFKYSVWGLVAGAANEHGGQVPDLAELFQHSASTLGGVEFGLPRFAPGTSTSGTPRSYLDLWESMQASIRQAAPMPEQWPVAYGLAIQNLFSMAKGHFDLGVLTRVVMDSAIATSKLKPALPAAAPAGVSAAPGG